MTQAAAHYKCPACGAALTFGSQSQQLDCASCGNSFPLEAIQQAAEIDVQNTTDDQMQWFFASHSDFDEAEFKTNVQKHFNDVGAYDDGNASKRVAEIVAKYCLKK